MSNLIVLPVVLPLVAGAFLLLFRPGKRWTRTVSAVCVSFLMVLVIGLVSVVAREGYVTLKFGAWEPPFGIVFVIDWLSVFMLFFMNLIGFCVVIYSFFKKNRGPDESPYFFALMMFQIAGVNGALSTGDIFNLFVWYEVMLISSYAIIAQGGYRHKVKGIPDYVVINIVSSTLFLFAIALTYASYGTLNMAHLAQIVQQGHSAAWSTPLAVIYFVVFGTKAAVFPLYFWIFRGYPLASTPVAALLGGMLTKVGVYSMLRVFPLLFPAEFMGETTLVRTLFYVVGALSIIIGVFGAVSRHEWKDLLSHHITSQIGYMVIGIGLWTQAALTATVFYLVQNAVVKSSLFLIGGMTEDFTGTTELEEQSGLIYNIPFVGVLFMTAGFALAGLPPFSGFVGKVSIFYAAFELAGGWAYFVTGVGLLGGLFTLYSMVKIWRLCFLGEPSEDWEGNIRSGLFVGPIIMVLVSILLGIAAGPVLKYAGKASRQLKNPDRYIESVLKDSPVHKVEHGEYSPKPVKKESSHH